MVGAGFDGTREPRSSRSRLVPYLTSPMRTYDSNGSCYTAGGIFSHSFPCMSLGSRIRRLLFLFSLFFQRDRLCTYTRTYVQNEQAARVFTYRSVLDLDRCLTRNTREKRESEREEERNHLTIRDGGGREAEHQPAGRSTADEPLQQSKVTWQAGTHPNSTGFALRMPRNAPLTQEGNTGV
jgi:hypothetical protein